MFRRQQRQAVRTAAITAGRNQGRPPANKGSMGANPKLNIRRVRGGRIQYGCGGTQRDLYDATIRYSGSVPQGMVRHWRDPVPRTPTSLRNPATVAAEAEARTSYPRVQTCAGRHSVRQARSSNMARDLVMPARHLRETVLHLQRGINIGVFLHSQHREAPFYVALLKGERLPRGEVF